MKNWAWSLHPDNAGDKADALGLIRSPSCCLFHCQSPDVTGTSENRGRLFFPLQTGFSLEPDLLKLTTAFCNKTQRKRGSGAQHCCYLLWLEGFGGGCCCVAVQRPSWDLITQVWNINYIRTNTLEQNSWEDCCTVSWVHSFLHKPDKPQSFMRTDHFELVCRSFTRITDFYINLAVVCR